MVGAPAQTGNPESLVEKCMVGANTGQSEVKGASLSGLTRHPDTATVLFDEFSGDEQAQTQTSPAGHDTVVNLHQAVED